MRYSRGTGLKLPKIGDFRPMGYGDLATFRAPVGVRSLGTRVRPPAGVRSVITRVRVFPRDRLLVTGES